MGMIVITIMGVGLHPSPNTIISKERNCLIYDHDHGFMMIMKIFQWWWWWWWWQMAMLVIFVHLHH